MFSPENAALVLRNIEVGFNAIFTFYCGLSLSPSIDGNLYERVDDYLMQKRSGLVQNIHLKRRPFSTLTVCEYGDESVILCGDFFIGANDVTSPIESVLSVSTYSIERGAYAKRYPSCTIDSINTSEYFKHLIAVAKVMRC